jgi:hypothetical protein
MSKCNSLFQDKQEADARKEAEKRVLAVRGSYDAPGFEACVEAEMQNIADEQSRQYSYDMEV